MIDGFIEYTDDRRNVIMSPGNFYILPDRTAYSLTSPDFFSDKYSTALVLFVISKPSLCDTLIEYSVNDFKILNDFLPFVEAVVEDCDTGRGENKFSVLMQNTSATLLNHFHILKPLNIHKDTNLDFVLDYINSNLDKNLSNEILAKIANSSKSNFIKNFTAQVKKSPQKYVLDIRMTYALKLLNENHRVEEICEKIGYENTTSFRRAFKKLFNRNPSDCVTNLWRVWK
jgi:AraC-like DNA-binding protein